MLFRSHELIGQELNQMIALMGMKNTPINKSLQNNEIINIGDSLQLRVIHTPGHTAGHLSFLELKSGIAFLGDIDLTNHPYYGNIDANLIDFEKSIKLLSNLDFNIVVTGHRGPILGKKKIKEEFAKYQFILDEREERILQNFSECKKPIKPSNLKNKNLIYKKYSLFKDFEVLAEELMIEKHFKKLETNNKIIYEGNGYILT